MSLRVARPGQMTWYVRPLALLIAPAVLVAIVPLATPTNAGSPPKLTITASVKRSDPKSCAYEWSATVRNEGPALVVEGTGQLISAEWPPLKQLTSGALPRLGPGDAATFAGGWSRSPGTTQLVLSAAVDDPSFGHASATKTEALPAEGTPSFAIENVKATDASYSFTVRNQIAEGMSAVYVRVSSAKAGTGPFEERVRTLTDCIGGSSTASFTGSKPSDHRFVKVQVTRGAAAVAETVFEQILVKVPIKAPPIKKPVP